MVSAQPTIFSAPPTALGKLSEAQSRQYVALTSRDEVKRSRLVTLNSAALKSTRIILNLFDDVVLVVSINSVRHGDKEAGEADQILQGTIEGHFESSVLMFAWERYVSARIQAGQRLFVTNYLGDGIMLISELDGRKLPPEECYDNAK